MLEILVLAVLLRQLQVVSHVAVVGVHLNLRSSLQLVRQVGYAGFYGLAYLF